MTDQLLKGAPATITVVFVLTPGLVLLDLAGPAQVFQSANAAGADYRVVHVASSPTVRSDQGVDLAATDEWPPLGAADLIIVPGRATAARTTNPAALSAEALVRLREHHRSGGTIASVCSGAFDLGQAGLLDHRRCTTHHELQDELARTHPSAEVVRDVLFTVDDRVITSAGIASGIDLALHLVAVAHGPSVAAAAARDMVVYTRRNGRDPQLSPLLIHRNHMDDLVHRVQDRIEDELDRTLPLRILASAEATSERTLTRAFVAATGTTPLRYQQTLRLEHAQSLIARGVSIDSAARQVGFADARMLRRLRSAERQRPD